MAGEEWRKVWQMGKEVAWGTDAAATRKMYFRDDSRLTREREPRIHKFATGSRDNIRNISLGPEKASGQVSLPVSAEILELLEMGIKGAVTGAGLAATKTWTFTPSSTLDSATLEWYDGARGWQMVGSYVESLKFAGKVDGESLLTAELIGKAITQVAMTAGLTDRVPAVFEGWEAALAIDAFGAVPGTTSIADTLIDWDVTIKNNYGRKYLGNNINAVSALPIGEIAIEGKIKFEAAPAVALTEFNNWDTGTKRIISLMFGHNALIGAGPDTEFVRVDIPGAWTAVDLGGNDNGTHVYELSLNYVYDPTNTFGLQVVVQTARTTVF